MDKNLAGRFYRNELLVVRRASDKSYYKNRREYIRNFVEPFNINLNPEETSLKREEDQQEQQEQ